MSMSIKSQNTVEIAKRKLRPIKSLAKSHQQPISPTSINRCPNTIETTSILVDRSRNYSRVMSPNLKKRTIISKDFQWGNCPVNMIDSSEQFFSFTSLDVKVSKRGSP